jgi:uncharacterized membrane protein
MSGLSFCYTGYIFGPKPIFEKGLNFLAIWAKVRGALALHDAFNHALTDAARLAGAFVDGGMQGEIDPGFAGRIDVIAQGAATRV